MRGTEQSCWSESRPSGWATGGRETERGRERRWGLQTRIREDEAPHQQPTPLHPAPINGRSRCVSRSRAGPLASSIHLHTPAQCSQLHFQGSKEDSRCMCGCRIPQGKHVFHFHAGPSSEHPKPQSPVHVISVKTTVLCSGRLQKP